jgi:hypothetical protein
MPDMMRARCGFLLALFSLSACVQSAPPVQAQVADTRTAIAEQRKDALMDELAACESGGHGDPNRGYYVGRYQFSTVTVINFVRERDGRTIGAAEARAIAKDDARASQLAKYMIFERDGASHWPACSRKLGLRAKVADIKATSI